MIEDVKFRANLASKPAVTGSNPVGRAKTARQVKNLSFRLALPFQRDVRQHPRWRDLHVQRAHQQHASSHRRRNMGFSVMPCGDIDASTNTLTITLQNTTNTDAGWYKSELESQLSCIRQLIQAQTQMLATFGRERPGPAVRSSLEQTFKKSSWPATTASRAKTTGDL